MTAPSSINNSGVQVSLSGPKPEEIDALLDQVEKKFLKSPEARKLSEIAAKDCACTAKSTTDWKEVDEMLKDFKFEDNSTKSKNSAPWVRSKIDPPEHVLEEERTSKKCFNVYVSGSYEVMGCCVSGAEKPCDKLKCLRCDFAVESFDNFAWHPSTDYLFLRNNVPDFEKLAAKLNKKKGSRAYCCQCRHLTANHLLNILSHPEVRWVCGRHPNPTSK